MFQIEKALERGKCFIKDLPLSRVLLQDDCRFPWLILVPRVPSAQEIYHLTSDQQHVLMDEVSLVSKVLQDYVQADKINIAAFGNIVPQLHIHIIARFKMDEAWPHSVVGLKGSLPYSLADRDKIVKDLSQMIFFS